MPPCVDVLFSCLMIRLPPRSTLFPSTTLFRSWGRGAPAIGRRPRPRAGVAVHAVYGAHGGFAARTSAGAPPCPADARRSGSRSEEHTSELQSRQYLVCRLLLEKKKKPTIREQR